MNLVIELLKREQEFYQKHFNKTKQDTLLLSEIETALAILEYHIKKCDCIHKNDSNIYNGTCLKCRRTIK